MDNKNIDTNYYNIFYKNHSPEMLKTNNQY